MDDRDEQMNTFVNDSHKRRKVQFTNSYTPNREEDLLQETYDIERIAQPTGAVRS